MQVFLSLLPELSLLVVIAILFFQCIQPIDKNVSLVTFRWLPIAIAGVTITAILCLFQTGLFFHGTYRIDAISQFFKLAIAIGFFFVVLIGTHSATIEEHQRADYFLFLAISSWGLMLLSSTVEMITMFVALEISSYALYVVIPIRALDKRAAEAGIKYALFGALATAMALYGYSYILAVCHTSFFIELAQSPWNWTNSPMAVLGLGLILCSLFFKLALFPFHFWCPDLYLGASNETGAFAATLPKLGVVAVLVRLTAFLKPGEELTTAIAIFAALSMTIGNLCALAQRDLKRLLGYSSIAHAGYITMGFITGTSLGLAGASFYSIVSLLMNLAIFWVICHLAHDGRNLSMNDLDGLFRREPTLALILAIAAFALLGLPPTAGFMGKLFLIAAAWDHGYNWLVVIALLNTAISLYYYLSIVRHAYTKDENSNATDVSQYKATSTLSLFLGSILAAALLLFGTIPGPLYNLALRASSQLLP